MMSSRTQRLLVLAAAVCLTGGVSVAAGPDDESRSDPPPFPPQRAIEAVDPDQRASFSILRRQSTGADEMPEAFADYVERAVTGDNGATPRFARRAITRADGVTVWVVPARGQICHFVLGGTTPGGGGCNRTAETLKGYGFGVEYADGGGTRIAGLVPDGVSEVVLRGTDGGEERTVPENNAFLFDTAMTPAQVEWGGNVIPVPAMPAG